jgi:hypothetical protein
MLDIEMMKRSIPLWRTDYTCTDPNIFTLASGIRAQGANLSWWLPISGAMASSEGLNTEYGFRSSMASGITMDVLTNQNHADKMIIGLVMTLVPGVAITNSVRDVIAGDFIAGFFVGVPAFRVMFFFSSITINLRAIGSYVI